MPSKSTRSEDRAEPHTAKAASAPVPFTDAVRKADAERPAGENVRIDEQEAFAPDVAAGKLDRLHRLSR